MSNGAKAGIGKYLPVYIVLLAIFFVEVFLAFRNLPTGTLVGILLLLAIGSASLGLVYFMHLAQERRSLFLTLIPATVGAMAAFVACSRVRLAPLRKRRG